MDKSYNMFNHLALLLIPGLRHSSENPNQKMKQPNTTPDQGHHMAIGRVTKTQENIIYNRAKKSPFSKQVLTMLRETDKTI